MSRDVTTSMVGIKNGHIRKDLIQSGEPQWYGWKTQKRKQMTTTLKLLPCQAPALDRLALRQYTVDAIESLIFYVSVAVRTIV